jgi:hypothetical protein
VCCFSALNCFLSVILFSKCKELIIAMSDIECVIFIFKIYGLIPRRSAAVKAVEKRSEKL